MRQADRGSSRSRLGLLDVIGGHFAAEVLFQLSRLGVITALQRPQTVASLARQVGIERRLLAAALQFVESTTDVLDRDGRGRYRVGRPSAAEALFQLRKFVGAYGPVVRSLGTEPVDGDLLGLAFSEARSPPLVSELVRRFGIQCLLDLGCGTASVLIELGRADPKLHGFGIEADHAMWRRATQTVRDAGLDDRIEILRGDARNPVKVLGRRRCARVDGVHGRSFLNALFGTGRIGAVEALRRIAKQLPGRPAWFLDYYGRLGQRTDVDGQPLALLQDLVQVLSQQGVPPPDSRAWIRIYRDAGCRLEHAHDFDGREITWFLHEVRLG